MGKKLTVNDATKDELIEYFFKPDCFGGGYRIPATQDKFLLWLQRKRSSELLTAQVYERTPENQPTDDKKFYEFLWNTINPNVMEMYLKMFRSKQEKTDGSDGQD